MKRLVPVLLLLLSCSSDPDVVDPGLLGEESTIVPHGKEDNFFSKSAREYLVEGRTEVVLDEKDADLSPAKRLAKAKRLIPLKQIALAWFLHSYIAPKDKKDNNAGYGGFNALTRNGSFEDLRIIELSDQRTFRFTFRQQIGGPLDLLDHLPVSVQADGEMHFDLAVGKIDNKTMGQLEYNDEWYREEPWKHFNPTKVSPDMLETLQLTIEPQPRSSDAWPDYKRLFADGAVSIGIHFGWDYNYGDHLKDSRRVFFYLKKAGFTTPVIDYDSLQRDSGPFTRTISANGKPVQVEVSLFWGKPGTATDPDTDKGGKQLEKDMFSSFAQREVIMFSGHSGPFYGFSLANWKKTDEGDLDDSKIPGMDMLESYQVVMAEGCETYAVGQAFWDNPAKTDRDNLDIITTTTYSTAYDALPVKDFLEAVVGTDDKGNHVPVSYGQLLGNLDYYTYEPAMYGVHGIDDNPHLHPWADPEWFCEPCSSDWDCGDAWGNYCVNVGTDGRFCTAECTADDGCPSGYTCAAVRKGQSITGRACVPSDYSCDGAAPEAVGVIINEVLADPINGPEGDANADGWYDASEDEFIEIVNATNKPVDIGGWTIADNVKVRFHFPSGVTLTAGAAAVVFGGGDIAPLPAAPDALVFAAEDGLSLANGGDTVIVRTAEGVVVDRLVYGPEAGSDRSLNRESEGDEDAAFVPHPGDAPFSPGTAADGSPF